MGLFIRRTFEINFSICFVGFQSLFMHFEMLTYGLKAIRPFIFHSIHCAVICAARVAGVHVLYRCIKESNFQSNLDLLKTRNHNEDDDDDRDTLSIFRYRKSITSSVSGYCGIFEWAQGKGHVSTRSASNKLKYYRLSYWRSLKSQQPYP